MVVEAPTAEPGARVGGKYELVRRLATGGMGDVWIARNDATGAEVAAKWCKVAGASGQAVERLRQEARVGAMLVHRNIVRVFDLVEDADRGLLLVMELLRGETLESYLHARGPLTPDDAIDIALPILSALAHAHAAGIIHRDVTPANVVLDVDPDGHVTPKLLDFGIAKVPESTVQTADGRVLGSPRYMAPERIRGKDIDPRSDLFSVGAVLYEMMTGASPFAAATPSASLAAVLENVVDPDPRIPPRVWIEIRRALSKQPYERHRDARAMAEALQASRGRTSEAFATAGAAGLDVGGGGLDASGRRVDTGSRARLDAASGSSREANATLSGPQDAPRLERGSDRAAPSTDEFMRDLLPIIGVRQATRADPEGTRKRDGRTKALVLGGALLVVFVVAAGVTIARTRAERTSPLGVAPAANAAPVTSGAPVAAPATATAPDVTTGAKSDDIPEAPRHAETPARPAPTTPPSAVSSPSHHAAHPTSAPKRGPRPIATSPGF